MKSTTLILRIAVAISLLAHSIPAILQHTVDDFGNLYLNQVGFAPYGVPLAWAIKISHIVCALLFLLNRYITPAAVVTIIILLSGIVMVHFKEGWFVVGLGRNGMEFNFLLICVLISILYQEKLEKKEVYNS